ncbi:MAG TPA: lipid II flippase MurJ [Terriglobales bacterium]|nr:lipid II flippase MurJ [Terriglobales bacterium]
MPRARPPRAIWIATALARSASAAKEVLLAAVFGTSAWKDALVVAWTAPTLLAAFCNESLPALLTPLWTSPADAGPRDVSARRLVSAALALLAALTLCGLLWPSVLVRAVAPAWRGARLHMALELEPWLGASIFFLGTQALLAARLNAARKFHWAPMAAGFPAVAVLAVLAATAADSVSQRALAVAAALTCGSSLGAGLLAIAAWRLPRRPRAPLSAATTAPWRPLGAMVLAMALLNLVPWAERAIASALGTGSVAALDYAQRLVQFTFGLTVAPFTAVAFTRLSESAGLGVGPESAFLRHVEVGLRSLLVAVVPVAAGLAVFARLVTRCIFGWGHFDKLSLAATAPVVGILGAGVPLDAAFYFLLFALYARQSAETKLPLAALLVALNVPLAALGSRQWGLPGVACAHIVSYAAALGWLARRKAPQFSGFHWRATLHPSLSAAALSLAAAAFTRLSLPADILAGTAPTLASWACLLAAGLGTVAGSMLLARCFAPGLLTDAFRGLRLLVTPAPIEAAA